MEEKYGNLNENCREKIKHLILSKMKKQQNQIFMADFRGLQEIL